MGDEVELELAPVMALALVSLVLPLAARGAGHENGERRNEEVLLLPTSWPIMRPGTSKMSKIAGMEGTSAVAAIVAAPRFVWRRRLCRVAEQTLREDARRAAEGSVEGSVRWSIVGCVMKDKGVLGC